MYNKNRTTQYINNKAQTNAQTKANTISVIWVVFAKRTKKQKATNKHEDNET